LSTAARYLHTVRHLRPVQVANRVWRRLYRPPLDRRPAPALRARPRGWAAPVANAPTLVAPTRVRMLNVERSCATAADWLAADAALLWRYHLHYFDDLAAREAAVREPWHRALLERWVAENPPGAAIAWDPYPTSRRIVNWIKWTLVGRQLAPACFASLAVQLRWLAGRLEYHLLGNHLVANAKALAFGGAFFTGAEADAWAQRARQLLASELEAQVLADGGHFERSPMYHAVVLEDLLDVLNLYQAYGETVPPAWGETAVHMLRWLAAMTHADGEIALFNDAAFGQAPTLAELEAYAARIGLGVRLAASRPPSLARLAESGYWRASVGDAELYCDCAPIGPDHQPGHAHADTLSFELDLGGRRVFVNSGTSEYGSGPERLRQRGTAAHNTVVVDAADSSEVWGGFRVARRARVIESDGQVTAEGVFVTGGHDGYRRLPGRNLHRRSWSLRDGSLLIDDEITGRKRSAVAWLHVHPDVAVSRSADAALLLTWQGGTARVGFEGADAVTIAPGTWHPRFGVAVPNASVAASFAGARLRTRVEWDARE
jgi:uncharacterized heparinase superfamily protein